MALSDDDVCKIAHLARLDLAAADVPRYADSLSAILGFVEQLRAVDTADITPMAHPLDAVQRLRAGEVSEHDQRDRFQSIAPQVDAGLYLVPKVIE